MKQSIFSIIIAILCGCSMVLISPPIGLSHLHWWNLVPLFVVLTTNSTPKRSSWLGYLFGVALITSNYRWISVSIMAFSNLPVILAWGAVLGYAILSAIPFTLLGYGAFVFRQRFGIWWIWLLPGLQVALEQTWPTLFPYYHGALFYRSSYIWQIASVFGVTSITYLIFLLNCLFTEMWLSRKNGILESIPRFHIIAPCLIIVLSLLFGFSRFHSVESELEKAQSIRVAMLQQNVTMEHRMQRNPWEAVRDWTQLTVKTLPKKPDLVVWPEGALGGPINPNDTRPYQVLGGQSLKEFFGGLAKKNDFDFLIGGGTITFHDEVDEQGYPTYTAFNSCYLFDHDGEITGRYDKMILLPFGEYMPLADVFPFLKLIQGPGKFQKGEQVTFFTATKATNPYTFSTPICYEAILNFQMRKMSNADLFINITNDAWFGDTPAPHQHAMLTTVQAIEWGRPLLRIAYTGVSFVVEPHGVIKYETKPFVEEARVEELRLGKIQTIYRMGGWIFPWLWVLASAVFLYRSREKNDINEPMVS